MTMFQPKWRDWKPGPPAQAPQEDNTGTSGTDAPIRPHTPTRGYKQQQQQQQQCNVINDFTPKGVSANECLHTHKEQGAKSAINKGLDGGEEARRRALPSPAWDAETAALIEWFLKTPPPPEPFELHQGVTIARPVHFWEYLRDDIAGGPGMGRARMGAFQKDLRRLAVLFGGPATVGGR